MEYRNLGRTGLKVSVLCLGTMQFGWTADEAASFSVLDAFVDAGGNFIDTANIYSRWADNSYAGKSEEIIGRWLKQRGRREDLVIATKVRGQMGPGPNDEGLSRKHIMRAVEASLRRLQTDYIDLYQAHWYDSNTPLEETLRAFDDLIAQGKVRYIGASNYPAWLLTKALWVSDKHGYARYDSLQPHYNLVHRAEFERELMHLCQDQGLGVIPYSPLAGGFLTGKYRRDQPVPPSARADWVKRHYFSDRGFTILETAEAIARERGRSVAQIALAWLLANPVVTSPIIGANSVQQLQELLPAVEVKLTAEEMARLNEVSAWE